MDWYKTTIVDIKVDESQKHTLYYDFGRILGKVEFYVMKDAKVYEENGRGINLSLFVFTPYAGKWHHVEEIDTSCYCTTSDNHEDLYDELCPELDEAVEAMMRYKNLYEIALEDNN